MIHTYTESLSIGTVAEGIIKCSWATIYDKDGAKIFTLQNRNFSRETIIPDKDRVWNKVDPGDFTGNANYALNLAWTTERLFEPVVVAREYHKGRMVPVELTPNAKLAILDILRLKKKWWESKIEAAKNSKHYVDQKLLARLESEANRTQAAIDYVSNLTTVYVKPKVFTWYPLNTFALTGTDVEEAKQAYEKSKKLLAVSAATIII